MRGVYGVEAASAQRRASDAAHARASRNTESHLEPIVRRHPSRRRRASRHTRRGARGAARCPRSRGCAHEGGLHTVASCFPSVTGPAYAPFLMGRFPGSDRTARPSLVRPRARAYAAFPTTRAATSATRWARSIATSTPDAPTIFELCDDEPRRAERDRPRTSPKPRRIGSITPRSALRAARTHFQRQRRRLARRSIAKSRDEVVQPRARRDAGVRVRGAHGRRQSVARARAGFAADHATRYESLMTRRPRSVPTPSARAGGTTMSLWIVSDHGHSRVTQHDDLARRRRGGGLSHDRRIRGCSVSAAGRGDGERQRDGASVSRRRASRRCRAAARARKWATLADALLDRPSVDLLIHRAMTRGVSFAARRAARLSHGSRRARYHYRRESGDPLAHRARSATA